MCFSRPALTFHSETIILSLKGWRRMDKNRVSSIMGWFRERLSRQRNEQNQVEQCESPSAPSSSTSICSSSSSSSSTKCPVSAAASSSEKPLPSFLFSSFRSALAYDLYLCHAEKDIDLAQSLAGFLEQPTKGLRCFMQDRDCALGGAVCTELLRALRDSHCWLLLVTPHFLKNEWCLYQMHQVLSEGPMSQRIIPAVLNMPRGELPLELRFIYTVDLNTNKEFGYTQVYQTVLQYLKDMCEKEDVSDR